MREIWNTFFATLPFTVTLMWTVILSLAFRNSGRARRFLTFFSFDCCVLFFAHAVHFLRLNSEIGWIDCLYTFCHLSVYPLFYLYIRILTDSSKVRVREFWILLPALFVALVEGVAVFFRRDPAPVLLMSDILFPTEVLLVLFCGYRRLRNFNRDVENFYADTEGKDVNPVMILLIIFAANSLVSVVSNIIGRDSFLNSPLLAIPSIVLTALCFAVLHVGYRQCFNADHLKVDIDESPEAPPELESDSALEDLYGRVRSAMERLELYRRPGLKISDVCAAVASNRTYVSCCINKYAGGTFSDYVNSYRMDYVKKILRANPDLNICDVGIRAGFSCESAFFRNFKKATGMTPSEWLRQQ